METSDVAPLTCRLKNCHRSLPSSHQSSKDKERSIELFNMIVTCTERPFLLSIILTTFLLVPSYSFKTNGNFLQRTRLSNDELQCTDKVLIAIIKSSIIYVTF